MSACTGLRGGGSKPLRYTNKTERKPGPETEENSNITLQLPRKCSSWHSHNNYPGQFLSHGQGCGSGMKILLMSPDSDPDPDPNYGKAWNPAPNSMPDPLIHHCLAHNKQPAGLNLFIFNCLFDWKTSIYAQQRPVACPFTIRATQTHIWEGSGTTTLAATHLLN